MSTVTELIAYLQNLPGDMEAIMAKDGEGNGFSPWCGDHSIGVYFPDSTYSGEFSEESDDEVNAIVLWPVN